MEIKRTGARRSRVRAGAHRPGAARRRGNRQATSPRAHSPHARPGGDRQRGVRPAVPRRAGRQGHVARRDRRVRERDGAVPQPVAVPARGRRERRRVQGAHPTEAARCSSPRPRPRRARAPGRLRLLRRERRRRRPGRVEDDDRVDRGDALPVPPPAGRAVAVHRRLLPPRRVAASPTTPPSTSSRWASAVSEPTAELFAENRYQEYLLLHGLGVEMAEALAELWHRRIREEWGFADEDGPTLGGPVPPAVPRRALLVGLPGVPRPRGQREGGRAARRRTRSASR